MQTTVTFRHMDATDSLRKYVEEKVARMNKYINKPIEANVVLSVEKHRHIAEISLIANKTVTNGKEETDNMYSSIDLVMDKIERQLRKRKEKIKGHKNTNTDQKSLSGRLNILASESFDNNEEPQVIKSENFSIKPMSIEEALMQLELSNCEFWVFINASSQKVNVIYRRKDGNYGLIEPDY